MTTTVHLIRGHDPRKAHLFAAVKKRREEFHATPEYKKLMEDLQGEKSSVKIRKARELGYKMGFHQTPAKF